MPDDAVLEMPVGEEVTAGGMLGDGEGLSETAGTTDTSDILGQVETETTREDSREEPETKPDRARQDAQRTAITKYLRELRGNAELKDIAEALNKSYFRDSEYQNLFPDMDELRNLKSTLDVMGGVESLTQLRDLEIGVEAMDRMVDQGDPRVVQDMARESPEGFKKLVPAVLSELEKLDARAYVEALRPHLARGIEQSGLGSTATNAMQLIQRAYNATDPEHARFYMEQAHSMLAQIDQWAKELTLAEGKTETAQLPATTSPKTASNPSIDMEKVRQESSVWAGNEFKTILKPFLAGKNLSQSAQDDLMAGIAMEVDNRLAQDADFQRNLQAWAQSGKTDRVMAWVKNGIGRVQADAARAVWERRYGGQNLPAKSAATASTQKTAPPNTQKTAKKDVVALQLPKRPPMDQLNMERDPDRLLYITHRGYMKDGRLVQWK